MNVDSEWLMHDLFRRVEREVEQVAHLAVETGVTFEVDDIVDAVERGLPAGYPAPTASGAESRRELVRQMA
ncbi:hypothetical protein ACFVGN_43245, partial [Streptomyces sp. NPDC057757]|uniref:hypothetical protein n=1 Tax=Streptomyces sp. NPDC057757 TaxID=3346241 RepID=UPI0036CAC08F